jgi:hypothetical protein
VTALEIPKSAAVRLNQLGPGNGPDEVGMPEEFRSIGLACKVKSPAPCEDDTVSQADHGLPPRHDTLTPVDAPGVVEAAVVSVVTP